MFACSGSSQFVPPINSVGLRKASMVVRIRMLLLLFVAVLYPAQSASACPGCLLLSPFRWLFGCDHYGSCGLANGHDCNRFIDDWFGYGYLRGQQGSMGHYPGNWYRQPHRLHGHGLHGGGLMAGGYGMPQPMMPQPMMAAPMPMPASIPMMPQGVYSMPAGGMYSASWDPCCDPCGDPCGGMGVSYGVATPMPTPMPMPMYDGASGSDCGCAGGGGGGAMMMPPTVPPAGMLPPQQSAPLGWVEPQLGWNQPQFQQMVWSGGGMYQAGWVNPGQLANGRQMSQSSAFAWPVQQAWRPQQVWQPVASVPQVWQQQAAYNPPAYNPPTYSPPVYGQAVYGQAPTAAMVQSAWRSAAMPQPVVTNMSQGWQPVQSMPQPVVQWQQPVVQWQQPGMQRQWQSGVQWQPVASGGVSAGIVPVVQANSPGSARLPFRRVSLASPPLGSAGTRNYPNALR